MAFGAMSCRLLYMPPPSGFSSHHTTHQTQPTASVQVTIGTLQCDDWQQRAEPRRYTVSAVSR
eukprot:1409741-Prymnesium_polylepis.1